MILVRDVFQLKFGMAREAMAAFKEGAEIRKRSGAAPSSERILTDLVGHYYTMVLETTWESLGAWEQSMKTTMGNEGWRHWYQKMLPLTESGHREIFNIVS
jgi:hypothetical protein